MTFRIILAALLGYSVGNLPDDGSAWLAIKLAFTVILLILLLRIIRQENAS